MEKFKTLRIDKLLDSFRGIGRVETTRKPNDQATLKGLDQRSKIAKADQKQLVWDTQEPTSEMIGSVKYLL